MEANAHPFQTVFANLLGPTNPCSTAVQMEPFSTLAFKVFIRIFATMTKICTQSDYNWAHALGFCAGMAATAGYGPDTPEPSIFRAI